MKELHAELTAIMEADYNGKLDDYGLLTAMQSVADSFGVDMDTVEYYYNQLQGV